MFNTRYVFSEKDNALTFFIDYNNNKSDFDGCLLFIHLLLELEEKKHEIEIQSHFATILITLTQVVY